MNDLEKTYLFGLENSSYQEEGSILESEEWVARMQDPDYTGFHSHYWQLLYGLIDGMREGKVDPIQTIVPSQSKTILYRYFPEYKKWFLAAPLNTADPQDEQRLRKKYDSVFSDEKTIGELDLLRFSLRSYPAVMVYDDDTWVKRIEISKTANMALSPEEVGVLDSILNDVQKGGKGYPLFINGRPGSGKSTVLQYLFAEHLYYHLSLSPDNRLSHPPIYLTYNDNLLRRAKETITDILKCDSKKVIGKPVDLEDKSVKEIFDQSFGHFHEFLYNLLPADEQLKLTKEKYVNYSRFRQMWENKFAKSPDQDIRKLSPELAWHVIRTFIKGMRQEDSDYFDIDSYKLELPRDQKTVTSEVFERIYNLWDAWYCPLCEDDGYWDDQDLTWRVLSNENINLAKYPAIFSDESQDFTYLELDLIFRLSLYSKKRVPSYLLSRVPFAFAGDPFQTLNPTGFNWQATQATFHDKIVRQLDINESTKLQINFRELGFNYRSTINIVQFCNLIQLLRGIAFNIPNLYPQLPWFNQSTSMPVYFEDTDSVGQALIHEQTELVIIPPCQEGEENEFVKNDNFLKTVALDGKGELIRNVQSPIRAKGLDFQRVVLYKFGQECIQYYPKLIDILENNGTTQISEDEELPLEYFVNRLYVAASRPQRRLFIIDTREGLEKFWRFAKDIDLREFLGRYRYSKKWSLDNLAKIQRGNRDNWEHDRDNPRELADQFLKEGREKGDVYQLKQAIINYRACKPPLEDKALLCQAVIYEIEGNYSSAGDQYASMNQGPDARRCYWTAQNFESIINLGKRDSNQINTLEHRAASFMVSQKSFSECKTFLSNLYQQVSIEETLKTKIITDQGWVRIINDIVRQLAILSESDILDVEWKVLYTELEYFKKAGVNINTVEDMAKIAFLAGYFTVSRDLLNQVKPNLSQVVSWITRLFAETNLYPQNLEYFEKLGEWKRILDEFKKHQHTDLKSAGIETIFKALVKEQALDTALSFVRQYPSSSRYGGVIFLSLRAQNIRLAKQLAELLIANFEKNSQWSEAIEFVTKGRIEGLDNDQVRLIQDSEIDESWRNTQFIKLLAESTRLSEESRISDKDKISNYLNRVLIQGKQIRQFNNLKVIEAGAAIERANKINDALVFYEKIIDGQWGNTPRDIKLAKLRWIVCKRRQKDRMDKQNAQRRADDDIKKKIADWNISETELTNLPVFPSIKFNNDTEGKPESKDAAHITILGDEVLILIGSHQYKCKTSVKKRRLEIRDLETDNLVIAYSDRAELACPDDPSLLSKGESGSKTTWIVKDWEIQFSFISRNDHYDISIENIHDEKEIYRFES